MLGAIDEWPLVTVFMTNKPLMSSADRGPGTRPGQGS